MVEMRLFFLFSYNKKGVNIIMRMKTNIISAVCLALLLVGLISLGGCAPQEEGAVVVGSKEFTEQLILGQITMIALEHNGIPTRDETGLSGTAIAREALEKGDIDLYWEYTGTTLISHLGYEHPITDPVECYNVVKEDDLEKNNLVWLDYTPFDNTYTLMMREDDAEALGIETISDLAGAIKAEKADPTGKGWVFATDHEYAIRDDGYPALCELYDFEFDDVIIMDLGITYGALRDGEIPVAMGFATDGRISTFGLVNLVDDLQFHPVYNCSPVVRGDALERYPEIADILNPIAHQLDEEAMSVLNAKVDIEDFAPQEVAEEWLKENGFID